jgi:hypothetical protein
MTETLRILFLSRIGDKEIIVMILSELIVNNKIFLKWGREKSC